MVFTDNASAECREGIVTLGKLNKSQAVGEERGTEEKRKKESEVETMSWPHL